MIAALPDVLFGRVEYADDGMRLKEPATDEEREAFEEFMRELEQGEAESFIVDIEG